MAAAFTSTSGVQLKGIAVSVAAAVATGFVTGRVLSAFGRRKSAYDDSEELVVEAG